MKFYVFLDVHGVLQTRQQADQDHSYLDPTKLDMLKLIHDETKCEFVLSSSWRDSGPLRHLVWSELAKRNIVGHFDNFRCIPQVDGGKTSGILQFIDCISERPSLDYCYVVLDDSNLETEYLVQRPAFKCKTDEGLTERITNNVIRFCKAVKEGQIDADT